MILSNTHLPSDTSNVAFSRRTLIGWGLSIPAVSAFLAACGDNSQSASTIEYPTGADDVVLRVGYEGGFVPAGFDFMHLPTVLITGDGRVFETGAQIEIFPQPLLPPLLVRSITPEGIGRVVKLADDARLLQAPPDYSGEMLVADAPDTVVVLNARGGSFRHQAYALGLGDDIEGGKMVDPAARDRLAKFVEYLATLDKVVGAANLGEAKPFDATQFRMQARVITEEEMASFEPAPTIVEWPAGTGVTLATANECALADASKVGTLFAGANQLTMFSEGGVTYQLAVVGMLPGESC